MKLSPFHLFQTNTSRTHRNLRKSLKFVLAKLCAFKKMVIKHHQRSKNKVYNIYFPYFYPLPCDIFSRKYYFFFRNTAFFKYFMDRQKHAGPIIVVNNIPNLHWGIYPIISANPKRCKLIFYFLTHMVYLSLQLQIFS